MNCRFYNNVRYLCLSKRIKIGEVERKAGVSAGYMSNHKEDSRRVRLDVAMAFSKALNISVNDLCDKDYVTPNKVEELERAIEELKKELGRLTNGQ